MKVSLLLFAGLGAAARGHDGPLRGSGSAASAPDEHRLGSDSGYSGLTLMLDRVRAGETESDDVVIGAIVDSYNKFHSGYSVVSAFKDEEIVIPVVDADGAYTDVLARYTVGWSTYPLSSSSSLSLSRCCPLVRYACCLSPSSALLTRPLLPRSWPPIRSVFLVRR
jgi:hypothetical protein